MQGWLPTLHDHTIFAGFAFSLRSSRLTEYATGPTLDGQCAAPSVVSLNDGLGSTGPLDLDFSILSKAVSEVEINQALVGHTSLSSHGLEVLNNILR
jgi:hypothetical protein